MSSGGSVATAVKIAEELDSGVIVAIICDRGDRYLSGFIRLVLIGLYKQLYLYFNFRKVS
jgi:predicted LPLAT superfamily acyltransferase